jgi:hypothetical protein
VIPFVIVVLLAVAVFTAMRLHQLRMRRAVQGRPVSMASLWRSWNALTDITGPERAAREAILAAIDSGDREAVLQSLLDFEASLKQVPEPMIALRKELMDSVDRRLLNLEILQLPDEVKNRLREQSSEMLQSDPQAKAYIAANDLRMAVLREYAAQRFGDRTDGDWFDVYLKASRLKQKGARNFIQRTLSGSQSSADDARYQTMTIVDSEIRARLLKMPAGIPFPGFASGTDTKSGS